MDSYRSLAAWQLAHAVCLQTLRGIDAAYHPRSRALFEQLRRAVISIEANIVEGYALGTRPYMLKHFRIAFGSAAESECLLRDAVELAYLPAATLDDVQPLLDRCMQTLRGLLRSSI
jgi:four helix bundle protein